MEQIKLSPETRERILAAARAARKSPSYPAELNTDVVYKDPALMMDEYRHFHGLTATKDDRILANGVTVDESHGEEGKHLWMDTQSHSSSASTDSQDSDFWLGYPTSFYTQFKVCSSCTQFALKSLHHIFNFALFNRFYHSEISKKHVRVCYHVSIGYKLSVWVLWLVPSGFNCQKQKNHCTTFKVGCFSPKHIGCYLPYLVH